MSLILLIMIIIWFSLSWALPSIEQPPFFLWFQANILYWPRVLLGLAAFVFLFLAIGRGFSVYVFGKHSGRQWRHNHANFTIRQFLLFLLSVSPFMVGIALFLQILSPSDVNWGGVTGYVSKRFIDQKIGENFGTIIVLAYLSLAFLIHIKYGWLHNLATKIEQAQEPEMKSAENPTPKSKLFSRLNSGQKNSLQRQTKQNTKSSSGALTSLRSKSKNQAKADKTRRPLPTINRDFRQPLPWLSKTPSRKSKPPWFEKKTLAPAQNVNLTSRGNAISDFTSPSWSNRSGTISTALSASSRPNLFTGYSEGQPHHNAMAAWQRQAPVPALEQTPVNSETAPNVADNIMPTRMTKTADAVETIKTADNQPPENQHPKDNETIQGLEIEPEQDPEIEIEENNFWNSRPISLLKKLDRRNNNEIYIFDVNEDRTLEKPKPNANLNFPKNADQHLEKSEEKSVTKEQDQILDNDNDFFDLRNRSSFISKYISQRYKSPYDAAYQDQNDDGENNEQNANYNQTEHYFQNPPESKVKYEDNAMYLASEQGNDWNAAGRLDNDYNDNDNENDNDNDEIDYHNLNSNKSIWNNEPLGNEQAINVTEFGPIAESPDSLGDTISLEESPDNQMEDESLEERTGRGTFSQQSKYNPRTTFGGYDPACMASDNYQRPEPEIDFAKFPSTGYAINDQPEPGKNIDLFNEQKAPITAGKETDQEAERLTEDQTGAEEDQNGHLKLSTLSFSAPIFKKNKNSSTLLNKDTDPNSSTDKDLDKDTDSESAYRANMNLFGDKAPAKPKTAIFDDETPYYFDKSEFNHYHVDDSSLQISPPENEFIFRTEMEIGSQKLEETLAQFSIEAKVIGTKRGPVITMYEVAIAPGIKVNRITNLSDDIALAFAAESVRIIAPIPGKSAIGIEVPNKKRSLVRLGDLRRSEWETKSKGLLKFPLGKKINGEIEGIDITRMPHLLIAGATGSGKSVLVNSIISSLIMRYDPSYLRFMMVDPKLVELQLYNNIPHLLYPVITDAKTATAGLFWAVQEMERRYHYLAELGVRDLHSYNKKVDHYRQNGDRTYIPLPYLVILIDEFADLMMVSGKELEDFITRIAQKARAVGIHLVLATQRPSVNIITGVIKANFPARIAFQVASKIDSRTILDQNGADKLLGKGDLLYQSPSTGFPVRMQGAMVTEEEVNSLVAKIRAKGKPRYVDLPLAEDDSSSIDSDEDSDELFDEALTIIKESRKASASYLQRRLRIGYNRAARLIESMEEKGLISQAQGSKPREILV